MQQDLINEQDLKEMINHWLHTPVGAYVGSNYGFDKQALLFRALSTMGGFDEMIEKLITDVPMLKIIGADNINFFSMPIPPDKQVIILQVGKFSFTVEG